MAEVIKVTLPDGKEICYRSPINTIIEVLRWIGPERFEDIPIKINGRPLVSRNTYSDMRNYTVEILPGWHFIRQADTRQRYLQLISINDSLNLELKIEIGDYKSQRNPCSGSESTRPKSLLRVTMPDGEIIDYDSFRDVFGTVVDKLGPRTISAKANFDWSDNQPLLTVTNTNGDRVKIGEYLYMKYPQTVKAAVKMLGLIARRLGMANEMIIETIPARRQIK